MGNSIDPLEELIRVSELVQVSLAQLYHLQHVQPQQIAPTQKFTIIHLVKPFLYPVLKTSASLRYALLIRTGNGY